jgi:hypothetical protein
VIFGHFRPQAANREWQLSGNNLLCQSSQEDMTIEIYNIKYGVCILTACASLLSTRQVIAGPPFMTDDPEPVPYQHHELYIASQQVTTKDGRSGSLPQLEYNYGAAPDLQLHIILPYSFNSPTSASPRQGIGDIELGAKYRFMQESESHPMVGVFPLLVTQTGDSTKGLGNGATQVFLPVWLQKRWGDWQSYGGGGYWINNATNTKNHWFFGWQLQKDISDHLTLGGEIYHSTEQVAEGGDSSGYNFGGFYNFDEHNHLLFSAGQSFTDINNANQSTSYMGYQLTW